MKIASLAGALALASALTLAAPATASELSYDFAFTGAGVSGSGNLLVDGTPDPAAPLPGAYDIIAIDGTVDGVPIDGLAGSAGAVEYSADGYFIYDDDFYIAGAASPAGGYLDDDGLMFTAGGSLFNLFFDGSSYWDWADQGGGVAVTFTAVDPPLPAPEPSSLWLMAAMLAGLAYTTRRKITFPAAARIAGR